MTHQYENNIAEFQKGAVQKLCNGQRGEGVDDFVTYRYVYFWGNDIYFMK